MTSTNNRQQTCEERIESHMTDRLNDLRLLVRVANGDEKDDFTAADLETLDGLGLEWEDWDTAEESAQDILNDYGLSVDVRKIVKVRYQLSWGGPSDEFEMEYEDGERTDAIYRFSDWFDTATRPLDEDDADMIDGLVGEHRFMDD